MIAAIPWLMLICGVLFLTSHPEQLDSLIKLYPSFTMKRFLAQVFAVILVAVIGLTGCSASGALVGNYQQDTLTLLTQLRTAINVASNDPNRAQIQAEAKKLMNDFSARYRRDASLTKLTSYTTIRTALNGLAGHYSSYPNRPLPEKLKLRLAQEFDQTEQSIKRGN